MTTVGKKALGLVVRYGGYKRKAMVSIPRLGDVFLSKALHFTFVPVHSARKRVILKQTGFPSRDNVVVWVTCES